MHSAFIKITKKLQKPENGIGIKVLSLECGVYCQSIAFISVSVLWTWKCLILSFKNVTPKNMDTIQQIANISGTTLEVCSPHLYASFGTFCAKLVNYSRHSEGWDESGKFSLYLQILEDFQTHLRGTFLDIFWNKGYHLKDRNLSYKSNPNLI